MKDDLQYLSKECLVDFDPMELNWANEHIAALSQDLGVIRDTLT